MAATDTVAPPEPSSGGQGENDTQVGNVLEVDNSDSAYGGEDDRTSFTSVASSIYNYRQENGRTYHAYKDGKYAFPNDELEQDRLDFQHYQFLRSLKGRLHLAPIGQSPQNVLDIGTGTGIWAIDFADEYPSARVIGTDLSPIQPSFVPPNCVFEIDDANEPWRYTVKFDFIHTRMLHHAVDERRLFQQAMEFLKPGGWIEMQELAQPPQSDDGTLTEESALHKWGQLMLSGSAKAGQSLGNAKHYASWMREAGLVNVDSRMYKWAQNPWPKDKHDKEIGALCQENTLEGLQGFTMGLFTRVHGWSREEVERFLVDVRKDIKDRSIHTWWPVYFVWGQKPY